MFANYGTHPNCLNDHWEPVTGHTWNSFHPIEIPTERRSEVVTEEELNAQQCEGAVEPTVYEIGERAFGINETVADELKQILFDAWAANNKDLAKRGGILNELNALEITGLLPDDWE